MVGVRGQRQIVVYSARADAAVFRAAAAAGGFRQLILRIRTMCPQLDLHRLQGSFYWSCELVL